MSDYLDRVRDQLVGASRELHARRRRRRRRQGTATVAVVAIVAAPALAATGVWRPQLGDGQTPAPNITADAPPPDQLEMLSVLRRPQTAADRSAASRSALRLLSGNSITGVRTNSIRLLAQSPRDRGIVLVPVARYARQSPPLPADAPAEVRKALDSPPIRDALCVLQLDVDGAGAGCWSSADVRAGRAWMALGQRTIWIVPDGVATIRSEPVNGKTVDIVVTDNAAVFDLPPSRHETQRTSFLDARGATVKVIEPPKPPPGGGPGGEQDPPAPGATHTGIIRRITVSGSGLDARYVLHIDQPHGMVMMRVILNRPACAGKRRVYDVPQGATGRMTQRGVHPSLGDFHRARWCAGFYTGYLREYRTGKRLGTFSFRVS